MRLPPIRVGSLIELPGVAASADVTAASMLERAPTWSGETRIVPSLARIVTGCENACSTRARAGSALRPPIRTPETETPGAISGVGVEAGAAAQASPAAATMAANVLSAATTGTALNQVSRAFSRVSVRPGPYRACPDGGGDLGTRFVLVRGGARSRGRARGRRAHGLGARAARLRGCRGRAGVPRRRVPRPRPVLAR